ncbi:hypothetical protein Tco_1235859 [Tanacetum coccineum]
MDLTLSLMSRVKEMAYLVNLKKALCNEDFDVVKISYLGELWVLLEFETAKAKDSLGVEETMMAELMISDANNGIGEAVMWRRTYRMEQKDYGENERDDNSFVNLEDGKDNSESVNKNSESKRSGHSKYSVLPRTGGSILNLMEEVVKVGQTMGYNMDGCIKDITEIIESQGEFGKQRWSIDLSSVRSCWGNSNFDYVHSDSVGNSGGILCIWDPNSFRRSSFTRSDYFVIVRGVWLKSGIDLMIVVVYARQRQRKRNDYGVPIFSILSYWRNFMVIRQEWLEILEELRSCDEVIDKGDCSNEVVHKRTEILNKIHQVNNIQASKIAQKAKIKWAIEGDENVKFFHGMLNKKSAIKLIVEGIRFDKPSVNRACIEPHFPFSLTIDQKEDLERIFLKEEVKRASGLRINMCKSKIMGANVEDGMVKNAASKLGCLVLKTPFTYLGTKVGGNMSRKQAWKEVVDKVLSRLSRWKMKLLSIGGRLTLLKSVLGSMPIFHMSIFKVPSSILKSLERPKVKKSSQTLKAQG